MKKFVKILMLLVAVILTVSLILVKTPVNNLWKELTFSWSEHTETEWKVKEYADEHGVSFFQYPKSLISLLERNPETEEFVLEYPFRQTAAVESPAVLPTVQQGEVPLFLQWDPNWGYETYGSDFLAVTGCGPTCLAMAGYYLTQDEGFRPNLIAKFAQKNGYYSKGSGSSWTLISEGAGKLGLKATELPLVKKKMVDAVQAGYPVILSMGAGDFTASGHYIVLTGVEDGQFRVNDPNSRIRSERLWSYEDIESQIRNIWKIENG